MIRFPRPQFIRSVSKLKARYLCRCGNKFVAFIGNVNKQHTRSCGCLKRKAGRLVGLTNKRHGHTRTLTHKTWIAMRNRCQNKNNYDYRNYGGRGIQVCAEWDDFRRFLADMGRRPSSHYSIDRVNVNGDYEPNNCRWATPKQQRKNQRPKQ